MDFAYFYGICWCLLATTKNWIASFNLTVFSMSSKTTCMFWSMNSFQQLVQCLMIKRVQSGQRNPQVSIIWRLSLFYHGMTSDVRSLLGYPSFCIKPRAVRDKHPICTLPHGLKFPQLVTVSIWSLLSSHFSLLFGIPGQWHTWVEGKPTQQPFLNFKEIICNGPSLSKMDTVFVHILI